MRAREPDRDGFAERDGVKLAYEVFGDDPARPTVVLLPTWQIVHSRHWKAHVPYLARHFRVVTFDGRGTGRSSRPVGARAYTDLECAADVVAVLDATGTDRAVLLALSCGPTWAIHTAADHPDRVSGIVALAPSCGLDVAQPHRETYAWDGEYDTTEGWAKYNRRYWLEGGYDEFAQWFFERMMSEAHSTKQIEDLVGWGHEIEPATLADATAGRLGCDGGSSTQSRRRGGPSPGCASWWWPGRASTRGRCRGPTAPTSGGTSPTCTSTSRRATRRCPRAGSRRAWS
jgi:pimeloyl-ACP methyl ester carboxylesterase